MLSESLPVSRGSSVFVRVDNDRVDVMRAVIIGPKGTRKNDGEKFNEKIVEKK
jgi:putative ubiquitin-RnfH superfamily antitoxin RatB of RatAB toxin-antitoxin module